MKVNIGSFPKVGNTQKVDVHIDYFDTWNSDVTLAYIIYPMLCQLKEGKQGLPTDFAFVGGEDHSLQTCFDFYSESYADSFDEQVKLWNTILEKMIWSFSQIVTNTQQENYHMTHDYVGLTKFNEQVQEGLELFGKHYLSLWS
jgi:hypothetical protein